MSELDGICHDKHEPINIDSKVRDRLIAFLHRQDVPRGMGYSAFLTWALNLAEMSLAPCRTRDFGYCEVHGGWNHTEVERHPRWFDHGAWPEDVPFVCDMMERGRITLK